MPGYEESNVYQTLKPWIQATASKYGIPELVLTRLLAQESVNFDPYYVYGPGKSPAGAAGVGQFMPGTAREMGISGKEFDPVVSIDAAARYLTQNLAYFKSKGLSTGTWEDQEAARQAIAAYNAGPGAVEAAIRKSQARTRDVVGPGPAGLSGITNAIAGVFGAKPSNPSYGTDWSSLLPGETQEYLRKVALPSLADVQEAATGRSTAGAQTYSDISQVPMPQPKDFPGLEEGTTDWNAYYQAVAAWQQTQGYKSAATQDYLRTLVSARGNEIAQGRLDLEAASESFNRQLDTFKAGRDSFANLLDYSLPPGITQLPITSPGNPRPQYIPASTISVNPMEEAMRMVGQAQPVPNVSTPQGSQDAMTAALAQAQAASNGGGLSGTPSYGPLGSIGAVANPVLDALRSLFK